MPLRATCNTFILKEDSKVRLAIYYKEYTYNFYIQQRPRVQAKITWTISFIEHVEMVPSEILKYITNSNGLFEIRIKTGTDIFRIFCFFNRQKEIVILNGFQKKTEKTPKKEIIKALQLKYNYEKENEYYNT